MTAEEILLLETSEDTINKLENWEKQHILDAMKEFAKLHVIEALKTAGNKAIELQKSDSRKYVSKHSIVFSYNLENIK